MKTDFDLEVAFDWSSASNIKVIVPNNYASAVCGLCGNNNQNPNDDLTTKGGKRTTNIAEFVESWKLADVPGCSSGCTGGCLGCKGAQKQTGEGDGYCEILIKKDGPFKQCHKTIDPKPYFTKCAAASVSYQGLGDARCNAISLYVAECQTKSISLEKWRSNSFCSKYLILNLC